MPLWCGAGLDQRMVLVLAEAQKVLLAAGSKLSATWISSPELGIQN